MLLLVFGRHVGAHRDGHEYGGSIQIWLIRTEYFDRNTGMKAIVLHFVVVACMANNGKFTSNCLGENANDFCRFCGDVTKTGNGERGTGNGELGTGNGERGTGNECLAVTRRRIQNGGQRKR